MRKTVSIQIKDYPIKTYDKIRYNDTDRQGHVNNAVFSTFFETGRAEVFYNVANPIAAENCCFVIANINMNLISEMHWPGVVDTGTGILKIGNSSVHLFQSLYQEGVLTAFAESVVVQINEETRKAFPLSDKARKYLEEHKLSNGLIDGLQA